MENISTISLSIIIIESRMSEQTLPLRNLSLVDRFQTQTWIFQQICVYCFFERIFKQIWSIYFDKQTEFPEAAV